MHRQRLTSNVHDRITAGFFLAMVTSKNGENFVSHG